MNPFKISFSLMGLIYILIIIVGFFGKGNVSALIGTVGFFWCTLGWWYADRYLA